jgi:rSAM/selenodomain-associated transferase 2
VQLSIIIPTFNEATAITQGLQDLLKTLEHCSDYEILVSDGGSRDDSLLLAQQFPVITLTGPAGRALQMNAGAQLATGEWLVFLHIDTRLPPDWTRLIQACPQTWGRFDLQLSGKHWLFRVIEKAINFRSRSTAVASGDQVLFFRRDFFEKLGGFPEIPLMEDIAISKKARTFCLPACLSETVVTSSRRWESKGIIRTVLLMWFLRFAFWLGIKPDKLYRLYYS